MNITMYSTVTKINGEGLASKDFSDKPAFNSSIMEIDDARAVSFALAT